MSAWGARGNCTRHSSKTGNTSRRDHSSTGGSSGSGLQRGRATEVTSVGTLTLGLVVQVKNEVQLLLIATWRVCTVVTGSGVTSNAGTVNDTTNVAEKVRVVVSGDRRGNNTAQSVVHTLTDASIRSRRQGSVGSPECTDTRTGGNGGGGRGSVNGGQGWRSRGKLSLQVVEVSQG